MQIDFPAVELPRPEEETFEVGTADERALVVIRTEIRVIDAAFRAPEVSEIAFEA